MVWGKQTQLVFIKGVGITALIAIAAKFLSKLPFLSIMGPLVIAIMIGVIWRAVWGIDEKIQTGASFSSKKLLRIGIILLGMRLNIVDIYHAGISVGVIAVICMVFSFFIVYVLARFFRVGKTLSILTACGTAICGAAAVIAIAPQLKAKQEETAVAAAAVAILGTVFTLGYTFLYAIFSFSSTEYGVFSGATLHEVAHVVAAASIAGQNALDIAVIVKLTRVALLIPVALIIGFLNKKNIRPKNKIGMAMNSIPWFIIGFLGMSAFHSTGLVSESLAQVIVNTAYLLMAMAMAGIGLQVDIKTCYTLGKKSFTAALIGSLCLAILGYLLVLLSRS
ncbi:YeiH family protein [Niallia sp. 03133]|uniref:YeiH family protein n=1 Tax=Niallia sp. 03133 TaxID=3458060 RepID=UPI004043ACAD